MMRCGSCSVAQLVAVLGMAGLGVGGYTYFSGDCSSCDDATTEATLVSTTDDASACCSAESKAAVMAAAKESGGCCHGETEAAVTTVADTEKSGCCAGEAKIACKHGTEGCTGDGKDGCCGGCAEELKAAEAEKVASSGAPSGGGK